MASDSSTEQRPEKRKRTSSLAEAGTSLSFTRSEVWFDDGNVVLRAKDTRFRVHQGILCNNSPIFNDMFVVASADPGASHEMPPVVELQDDPVDVERMLRALYDRSCVF